MLHTGGQYKSRKIINDDIFSLLFLLFIDVFKQEGITRVGSLLMTTFSPCSFWYLFLCLPTGGHYKSRKIINDDIFLLLFFVIYFNTFLQVGSTRAGRSNGSSWLNRKREAMASQSGPSGILKS
jgi:uncharacterized membrane protein